MLRQTRKISQLLLVALAAVTIFAATPAVAAPSTPAPAATTTPVCKDGAILTFPSWFRGLARTDDCRVSFNALSDVWIIALNLIEILLQVVAYAAVFYIIWGGIKYIKSQGDPSAISGAKSAILNAVLGLGISLGSVAIVNFVVKSISASAGNASTYSLPNAAASGAQLGHILNNAIFPIAGVIAVIFIIIGGIQFMTSSGDPSNIKRARDTILYAVVGLVVVTVAFAIVQFLLGRVG